jgi:glycosyltransferase involved in cell wall biosynthesis
MARINPKVSVVMGVHNGASSLGSTINSILEQDGVDLEFIVVDDGSSDDTPSILSDLASRDARLRVIHQERGGLTRALMRGCAEARAPYIARQDCGDISLPERLKIELALLESHGEVALVSCATRYVGPGGEWLYDAAVSPEQADHGLLALDLRTIHGPAHHGSTMFRRDIYEKVGGYRKEFYFAQDLDLWTRLAERGRHVALPEILYQATFALNSISSLHRERQIECAQAIFECARSRRAGQSEASGLSRAALIRPRAQKPRRMDMAAALYFVGGCLRQHGDRRARQYFLQALRTHPLHWKSALRLLLA